MANNRTISAVHGPRAYRGSADLLDLIRFGQRIWTADARWHVGDLAWDLGLSPDETEVRTIALWERDGEIAGVGWLSHPDQLSVILGPDDAALLERIIAWADDLAGTPTTVTVLDTERWLAEPLRLWGYLADLDGPHFLAMHRDVTDHDADLRAGPDVPAGFRVRRLAGDDELPARFALHRAVWTGSTTSDTALREMTRRWPYSIDFDWVVEAPNGTLVSYILGWYDDVHRVGEFEPVGTLAEFRRRGLSRAVGIAVIGAFRDAGAERALVYARGDDDYPVPRQVYGSLGFAARGRTVKYRPNR